MIMWISLQFGYQNELFYINDYEYQKYRLEYGEYNRMQCEEHILGMYKCWCRYPFRYNFSAPNYCNAITTIDPKLQYQGQQRCLTIGCYGECYTSQSGKIVCFRCELDGISVGSRCYQRQQRSDRRICYYKEKNSIQCIDEQKGQD